MPATQGPSGEVCSRETDQKYHPPLTAIRGVITVLKRTLYLSQPAAILAISLRTILIVSSDLNSDRSRGLFSTVFIPMKSEQDLLSD
jgi:hypothetical protein